MARKLNLELSKICLISCLRERKLQNPMPLQEFRVQGFGGLPQGAWLEKMLSLSISCWTLGPVGILQWRFVLKGLGQLCSATGLYCWVTRGEKICDPNKYRAIMICPINVHGVPSC